MRGLDPGQAHRRTDLFGGRGEVLVWDLLGRSDLPSFAAVLACELAPGGSVGRHVQQEHDEIVVFTSGRGTVEVGGAMRDVGPGSVVTLPFGRTLAIANASNEPLEYLIVKAPRTGLERGP